MHAVATASETAATPAAHQHAAYRADIDGLRGIAVLAVVAFHAFPDSFGSGFIGVDVFFVLSGFLISGIILSDLSRDRFTYRRFYERRILRIFPALGVVLAACLLIGWFWLFPDEYVSLGSQTFGGAAFLANIVLWRQTGYFDQAANTKPLLHLWSLGVEEQFYFVWPLVLALVWKSRHRATYVAVLLVGSFTLNAAFVKGHPDATFYLPVSRFWEILIGVMVAVWIPATTDVHNIQPDMRNGATSRSNALAAAGLALLALSFAVVDASRPFPGWWGLLPTLSTAAFIGAGPGSWINRHVLAAPWLVAIGLISYPLYLWHWPLLAFSNMFHPAGLPPLSLRIGIVVASLLLATITYLFVERPIRFGKRRSATVPALCTVVASLCVAGWIAGSGQFAPRSDRGEFQKIWDAVNDWDPFEQGFVTAQLGEIKVRLLGGPSDRVLFIGDSNIEQYGPRMSRLYASAPERTSPVLIAAVGGCPPIPRVLENNHPDCARFLSNALALASHPTVRRIVVGACWNCYLRQSRRPDERFHYYFDNDGTQLFLNDGPASDAAALGSLERMLRALAAIRPTTLLLNIPAGDMVDPKRMIVRDPWRGQLALQVPVFRREAYLAEYGGLREKLKTVAANAGVAIIDPLDVLCPSEVCPIVTSDGRPLYRDADHLRPFYIAEHATYIDQALQLR